MIQRSLFSVFKMSIKHWRRHEGLNEKLYSQTCLLMSIYLLKNSSFECCYHIEMRSFFDGKFSFRVVKHVFLTEEEKKLIFISRETQCGGRCAQKIKIHGIFWHDTMTSLSVYCCECLIKAISFISLFVVVSLSLCSNKTITVKVFPGGNGMSFISRFLIKFHMLMAVSKDMLLIKPA